MQAPAAVPFRLFDTGPEGASASLQRIQASAASSIAQDEAFKQAMAMHRAFLPASGGAAPPVAAQPTGGPPPSSSQPSSSSQVTLSSPASRLDRIGSESCCQAALEEGNHFICLAQVSNCPRARLVNLAVNFHGLLPLCHGKQDPILARGDRSKNITQFDLNRAPLTCLTSQS